jgi:hypothetical protein
MKKCIFLTPHPAPYYEEKIEEPKHCSPLASGMD